MYLFRSEALIRPRFFYFTRYKSTLISYMRQALSIGSLIIVIVAIWVLGNKNLSLVQQLFLYMTVLFSGVSALTLARRIDKE